MRARAPIASAALSTAVAALVIAGVGRGEDDEPTPATALVAAAWQDTAAASWRPAAPAISGLQIPVPPARARGITAAVTLDGARGGTSGGAGRADGWLRLPLSPRLTAELGAAVLTRNRGAGFDRQATRTQARLAIGDGPAGAWLGVAFERSLSGEQPPHRPMLSLGVASRANDVTFSASLEQSLERVRVETRLPVEGDPFGLPDTVPIYSETTISETRFSTATHGVVSARWEHRRLSVETATGLTFDRLTPPQWWTQSSASVAVLPRLAIFATVGSPAPRWLAQRAGLSRGAALGVHLTSAANPAVTHVVAQPSRPGWRLRHLTGDLYTIEIRAPHGDQVTIMGDFTEWRPVPLLHLAGDRWGVAVRIAPGVHQVQAQVDQGEWSPPAGLATSADGFNGLAGVFVAE